MLHPKSPQSSFYGSYLVPQDYLTGTALVTSDTPPRKIVAGVPAKVFRDVPSEQLLDNQGWKDE